MPSFRTLVALAPLLAVCACATAPTSKPAATVSAPVKSPAEEFAAADGASAYGLFLAGRGALDQGHSEDAARFFDRAAATDEDATFLTGRAFSAALLAGDVKHAAAVAPTGPDADPSEARLGALVRAVEALASGRAKEARAILIGPDIGYPHRGAASLLAPWAAAAAGDSEGSITHPITPGEPVAQFFANLDQGKLFERARRYDEAETDFKSLIGGGDPGGLASAAYGAMLERRGRRADALAVYDAGLARAPNDGVLKIARQRVIDRKSAPPMESIRQGAAESLIGPAAALLFQKQEDTALIYLRLAVRLDPTRDEAWVLIGDVMSNAGDIDMARDAYERPKPGSDQYVGARTKLAWSYQSAGDKDGALKTALETVAAAPKDLDAQVTLADIYRADERYEDSAKVLDGVLTAQGASPDWRLYYMRAVALQESGHWDEAERDLQAALKQRPDEPELLNFLGYSWIDRGERLTEAVAMVKRAVDLNPQSGAMLDSLGWGYYRMGDFKTAVEKLETAVELEPADAEVNNHLGDAYWRVGRKTEAQFQWRRVLSLEPSSKLKAEVEEKLRTGLGGPTTPALIAGK